MYTEAGGSLGTGMCQVLPLAKRLCLLSLCMEGNIGQNFICCYSHRQEKFNIPSDEAIIKALNSKHICLLQLPT